MRADVLHTELTPNEIRRAPVEKHFEISPDAVRSLLEREGYRLRRMCKGLAMGEHADRDAQFQNIARIESEYLASGEPILSIDTKKRELPGTFYRDGRVYARKSILAWDHDFANFASGVAIPYGLYDIARNSGYISPGTSKDTAEFACDSVAWWWDQHGRQLYPAARSLCLLCDGGGSNSSLEYIFEEDLEKLSDRLGLEIRICHYPPYCSKYNPIERRLFCHITRACQGALFDSVATVARLIENTRTATGLGVVVGVLDKIYRTGRTYAEGFKDRMRIVFDDYLPKWNYRTVPSVG